jgi:HEAT repeat protein
MPALRKMLDANDKQTRITAALALFRIGTPANEVMPVLLKVWEKPGSTLTRLSLNEATGEIGTDAKEAALYLKAQLQHPDHDLRLTSAIALYRIDPTAEEAVKTLLQESQHEDPEIGLNALRALCGVPSHHEAALDRLQKALTDEQLKDKVVRILGELGSAAENAVPALQEMRNKTNNSWERRQINKALRQIAQGGKGAKG